MPKCLQVAVHHILSVEILKCQDYFRQVEASQGLRKPSGLVQMEEEFAPGTEVEDEEEIMALIDRQTEGSTDWKA